MISFTSFVIFGAISIVCYAFYKDISNKEWSLLVGAFRCRSEISTSGFKVQPVYVKNEGDEDYIEINSMKVKSNGDGTFFFPTINHYLLKPIFIPWSRLNLKKEKNIFIHRMNEYEVEGLKLLIVF